MCATEFPEEGDELSVKELIAGFRSLQSDVQRLHLPDETTQELEEIAQAAEKELSALLVTDVLPQSYVCLEAMPYLTICFYELAELSKEGEMTDEQVGSAIRTLAEFQNLLLLTHTGIYMEQ